MPKAQRALREEEGGAIRARGLGRRCQKLHLSLNSITTLCELDKDDDNRNATVDTEKPTRPNPSEEQRTLYWNIHVRREREIPDTKERSKSSHV